MFQAQNNNDPNKKYYDLEERTFEFAKAVRIFIKKIPKTIGNIEDGKQVVRSSGSIGANYIEANESLSKKDFVMRVKISRKEAKETRFWLKLVDTGENKMLESERMELLNEVEQLMKIFGAIVTKSV